MDQERFDTITRTLASGISRRGVVRTLGGATLGGILAAVAVGEAGAKKKKKRGSGKRKGRGQGQAAKVAVCHYDADADTHIVIDVSQSGWDNGHAKHERDFLRGATENGCCRDSECSGLTDQCNAGTCVVNDDRVGACKAVPTPGESCADGGTCDDGGDCVAGCTPKTCAQLGRTCGTAPDGCGNPLDCGPASVCGSDTATNCCGGRCCKANGISCTSNAECCNGDCLKFLGFGTCNAFTNYTCAP